MLTVRDLNAYYGRAHILGDVALEVAAGEVAVLLGRNGAGKSTTLKSIVGWLRPRSGEIVFDGRRIERLPMWRIARSGLGYVPEDRRIFAGLTVLENLEAGRRPARAGVPDWPLEALYALFPALAGMQDRVAERMSGGEQQMLSIARTLAGNPALLLLDEPSEGLSPVVVEQLARTLVRIRRRGTGMLLCEQNLAFARRVAERAYVLERGTLVRSGTLAALDADPKLREEYLSV